MKLHVFYKILFSKSCNWYFDRFLADTSEYWDYMYVMRVPRENRSKSDVEVKGDCYKCLKIAALTIS